MPRASFRSLLFCCVKEYFGVSRLDAKNGKAHFCQPFKQPLGQGASLNAYPLKTEGRIAQDRYKVLRMRCHLPFPAYVPALIDDTDARFFDRDIEADIVVVPGFRQATCIIGSGVRLILPGG
ncbi:hypothetical protein RLEG12_07555 (plasmid) [Rhizobium leguminosarum bv. trifolii CB782]|nr:hypothetical protein RLEG12_07555 [Rhizobium leguminosarum bv. trifolii CB782]